MVAQPTPPLMTVEEYLELERHSDVKHEYIDGYVYAMAGGTSTQSVISANIIALLRPHLRGGPCRVHTSGPVHMTVDVFGARTSHRRGR